MNWFPGQFHRDISFLRAFIGVFSRIFPQLRFLSVEESLEEFASLMSIQLDLRNEAANLGRFQRNFKNESNVKFPTPILELCSEQILVETFEAGEPIGQVSH